MTSLGIYGPKYKATAINPVIWEPLETLIQFAAKTNFRRLSAPSIENKIFFF